MSMILSPDCPLPFPDFDRFRSWKNSRCRSSQTTAHRAGICPRFVSGSLNLIDKELKTCPECHYEDWERVWKKHVLGCVSCRTGLVSWRFRESPRLPCPDDFHGTKWKRRPVRKRHARLLPHEREPSLLQGQTPDHSLPDFAVRPLKTLSGGTCLRGGANTPAGSPDHCGLQPESTKADAGQPVASRPFSAPILRFFSRQSTSFDLRPARFVKNRIVTPFLNVLEPSGRTHVTSPAIVFFPVLAGTAFKRPLPFR